MTKNGKYVFVALGIVAVIATQIGIYVLSTYEKTPHLNQYLNRLLEFFELTHLDDARAQFLQLVNSGIEPGEAFWATVLKVTHD